MVRTSTCKTCKFAAMETHSRFCHLNPPQIFVVPTPKGVTVQSGHPMVSDTMWCSHWIKRIEIEAASEIPLGTKQ